MTVIPVPRTQDEILGFCRSVAHEINTSEGGISALLGNTYGAAIARKSYLRNSADNEEFEFVVELEDPSGKCFEWAERLSQLRKVVNYGHLRGYYFSSTTMKSMVLYLN